MIFAKMKLRFQVKYPWRKLSHPSNKPGRERPLTFQSSSKNTVPVFPLLSFRFKGHSENVNHINQPYFRSLINKRSRKKRVISNG